MMNFRQLLKASASRSRGHLLRQSLCQGRVKYLSTIEQPPGQKNTEVHQIPKGILGQPTCYTHPHLISEGHLTCGITQAEFKERRDNLVSRLISEMDNVHLNHIIVIPAACKQYMSDKIPYVFRQNSDFFYLTGCLEPSAVLVMIKPMQSSSYKTIMFVHEKDEHAELWEGPRTGCAGAARLFCADEATPVEAFPGYLSKLIGESRPAALWYHTDEPANPELHRHIRSSLQTDTLKLADPQRALHFMRSVKSAAELELMRETCYVGSQAMNMAMACTRPGISESMVNAVLDFSCRQAGAEQLGFPPVVAGGVRATHIHYVANNQLLAEDEMLLVDSGSQRWLYNSDISRTWPVSGKFSTHHQILYELVLTVQKRLIELLGQQRPPLDQLFDSMCRLLGKHLREEGIIPRNVDGNELIGKRLIELLGQQRPPLDQLFDSMCRLLGKHLREEGIIPRNVDGNELIGRAYKLCPHHVSHYLGLDIHDTPLVKRNMPVQENMVVTVEPGLYIRADDTSVPAEFRGLGIRIEDDVLVTSGAPVVLTESCVKEVRDIEALVGKNNV